MKQCVVCKEMLPATTEYFYPEKRVSSGLKAKCKKCFLVESARINKGRWHDKEARKKYIEDNKEKLQLRWKEYRQRNKEKIAQSKQRYYNENKQVITFSVKKYQSVNKDSIMLKQKVYKRTRYTDEVSNYSIEDWNNCKRYFDNKCAYCGGKRKLDKEHFVPFKHGGEYSVLNILPACRSCNSSKYDKNFFEWYKLQSIYSVERERKILRYLNYDIKTKTQQLALI